MPARTENIANFVRTQRDIAADKLVVGVSLLGIVGFVFSIARTIETGWQLLYAFHGGLACFAIGVAVFRGKLTTSTKAGMLMVGCYLVGLSGLLQYGFYSSGEMWLMLALLLSMFFFDKRVTYGLAITIILTYAFSSWLFVYGGKVFPTDANLFLLQLSSWVSVLFGSLMFVVLIYSIVLNQHGKTDELLLLLDKKNQEISRLANYDSLTGLPVRHFFIKSVETALSLQARENRFVALCFIDLDGFKPINDVFGHDAGDHVLKTVAQRISTTIRAHEIAARVGGDEFVVLLTSAEDSDLREICRRLVAVISEPYVFEGESLVVSASIGVARSLGKEETAEGLIKRADGAMYEVKRHGKNAFRIV